MGNRLNLSPILCQNAPRCRILPSPFVLGWKRPRCPAEEENTMCRNIKTLFNFEPPATHAEIHASALQFVRKLSGFNSPSQANTEAFNRAVSEVSDSARRLLASLQTNAPARDRDVEAEKARERSRLRFGEFGFPRDASHGVRM